jgi:hypothetical protein
MSRSRRATPSRETRDRGRRRPRRSGTGFCSMSGETRRMHPHDAPPAAPHERWMRTRAGSFRATSTASLLLPTSVPASSPSRASHRQVLTSDRSRGEPFSKSADRRSWPVALFTSKRRATWLEATAWHVVFGATRPGPAAPEAKSGLVTLVHPVAHPEPSALVAEIGGHELGAGVRIGLTRRARPRKTLPSPAPGEPHTAIRSTQATAEARVLAS